MIVGDTFLQKVLPHAPFQNLWIGGIFILFFFTLSFQMIR